MVVLSSMRCQWYDVMATKQSAEMTMLMTTTTTIRGACQLGRHPSYGSTWAMVTW